MIRKNDFFSLLRQSDFKELFISELGWNRYTGQAALPVISVDGTDYHVRTIAELKGYQVLECEVDEIPTQGVAKKLDAKLRRQVCDFICIYRLRASSHHLWVVPLRSNEKRDLVLVEYEDAAKAEVLYQKIHGICFDFDEDVNIVDLRAKVQSAFAVNSEKITKDFYAGFKKEHKAFAEFISGMDDDVDAKDNRYKQWYTSVMLNRLMFCYFIQKKGFLDLDTNYLGNKLKWVRENQGSGKFFSFYRSFLLHLFHDGLNSHKHDADFIRIFGKIPYLNGGMFDEHQLEKDFPDVDIADEAFLRLFDFFDKWNWHLDTRLTASGRDINPDVLGYIFEQYINDRAQMGAYYTKEDITEYIGRNCILPFLFDRVRTATKESARDFEPEGFVWRFLRESGDRYIFDAVKKGYNLRDQIPDNIRRGIITPEMHHEYAETPMGELTEDHVPLSDLRADWNQRTPAQFALPTEIWRETIERLDRCHNILGKIQRGEITSINDFITYNLDIRSFAIDLLAKADHKFVGHFYHALQSVSVLDPTCGSGAFLFAALNILEPLYEACIDRMQDFNRENPKHFEKELAEINRKYRSNIQYFIFKSIILRNLYGVDIMAEATEIAKLRLFLKMVAVVDVDRRADNLGLDPLPDIDFNIRCGNTLVGYANEEQLSRDLNSAKDILEALANQEFKEKIDSEMEKVSIVYERFKELQLHQDEDMAAFKDAKRQLLNRLATLNAALNQRLYLATHAACKNSEETFQTPEYFEWLNSHHPFHWLAEFYGIIHSNRGFDVIIGNPPYVEYNKKDKVLGKRLSEIYQISNFSTLECGNLYAFVIERCSISLNNSGFFGFIVPSASLSTPRMRPLEAVIEKTGKLWASFWDERPSTLFDGVCLQLCILLHSPSQDQNHEVTAMGHWASEERINIFKKLNFTSSPIEFKIAAVIPKLGGIKEFEIVKKLHANSISYHGLNLTGSEKSKIFYKNAGGRYWRLAKSFPTFYSSTFGTSTSTEKELIVPKDLKSLFIGILTSSNFYWFWRVVSNCRHLTSRELEVISIPKIIEKDPAILDDLVSRLENDMKKHKVRTKTNSSTKGEIVQDFYFVRLSKPIIDEIDQVLAKHYGFTDEELDFIINYDIKYRMGDELNADE